MTGQDGTVALLQEAAATHFQRHRCQVQPLPTPEVIPVWDQAEGQRGEILCGGPAGQGRGWLGPHGGP